MTATATPEQAALIRFQHDRRGTSVKMLAAIMGLSQAAVRAALAEPEPATLAQDLHTCPAQSGGPARGPSTPTVSEGPPRAAGARRSAPANGKAKKPDLAPQRAPHATASGYVPIMSDAYRRRPA